MEMLVGTVTVNFWLAVCATKLLVESKVMAIAMAKSNG